MSDEYLMTGSFGLDVDRWQGSFYDDDLPSDWRAASYSTQLRSVLLPQSEWRRAVKDNWIDEVDDAFRFVLYCSLLSGDMEQRKVIAELASIPVRFSDQVAGLVVEFDSATKESELESLAGRLRELFPLCLDAGKVDYSAAGMDGFCQKQDLSCVWYPASQAEPLPTGDFLVALIDDEKLPQQREIVEKIDKWMAGQRRAGLFNTNMNDAPLRAEETRILAELMGV